MNSWNSKVNDEIRLDSLKFSERLKWIIETFN